MTYWSSSSEMRLGLGIWRPRLKSALLLTFNSSSSMISRHNSTHSSQMYAAPGPATSLRTSSWLLPQNEHRYRGLPLLGLCILVGLLFRHGSVTQCWLGKSLNLYVSIGQAHQSAAPITRCPATPTRRQ